MPIYEFHCPICNKDFEELRTYDKRDEGCCPDCHGLAERKASLFSFKLHNPFTKDGEGFTSKRYNRQEYKGRVRHNVGKHEKL